MLPTFVIGLREGLEAVLIVSIIATFLRRNGAPLRPMWFGVAAAVALSIAVGVVLKVVEQALPQRQQEGMETIIGLVAVCFVTGMVVWMRTHARYLKRELEGAAQQALKNGTTAALVAMVFLAVLREGFETSVFLLATFQAASNTLTAALGAVLGIAGAIVLGFGIYFGGVRINLGRFFSVTSAFLILVAAGLVLSALRTAHEAGWLMIGQARTVDLSWLAPAGSIRSALITGVLGIPADPRVVEALGWCCYVVPVLALTFWPARWRPSADRLPRARAIGAGVLALAAVALFVAVPRPSTTIPATAPLADGGTARVAVHGDEATLTLRQAGSTQKIRLTGPRTPSTGHADTQWTGAADDDSLPNTLTAQGLLTYTGGRVPVGLDLSQAPGPYTARWTDHAAVRVQTYRDGLVAAAQHGSLLLTLTGGGLTSPRVFSVTAPGSSGEWTLASSATSTRTAQLDTLAQTARDRTLWTHWLPGLLLVGAFGLLALAYRDRRAGRAAEPGHTDPTTDPTTGDSAAAEVPDNDRPANAAPAR